jgi:hypothetical protein
MDTPQFTPEELDGLANNAEVLSRSIDRFMMKEGRQPTLPYQPQSPTSKAAAKAAKPAAGTHRANVLAMLAKVGAMGLTDEQMQDILDMNPSTQRPRRIELVRSGHVKDSGRKRNTTSGRKATVWEVVK